MSVLPLILSNKYSQIKNFFVGISPENEKILDFTVTQVEAHNYIDFSLTIEQKIELEKRRRYQAYMTLDYLLSAIHYFDFFSIDAIDIAKKSKNISQVFEKEIVETDLFLLPFFKLNTELPNILQRYGITEKEVSELVYNRYKVSYKKIIPKIRKSVKNFFLRLDIPILSESLVVPKSTKFGFEIQFIFEEAARNALTRFKTPVINSEILLITMLEAKRTKIGKLLKKLLKTKTNWYMLRYNLMKRLHSQELAIRTEVPKNQQYFAYLLKTELPEFQFDTLIEKECLLPGVLLFRNNMIAEVMKLDFYTLLKTDILYSIKSSKKRKYST